MKNIQDTFQMFFTTFPAHNNSDKNVTPEIKELILLKH